MKKWQVDYFYLASGMEGKADERDYGVHEANSASEAVDKAVLEKHGTEDMTFKLFVQGCLSATEIPSGKDKIYRAWSNFTDGQPYALGYFKSKENAEKALDELPTEEGCDPLRGVDEIELMD